MELFKSNEKYVVVFSGQDIKGKGGCPNCAAYGTVWGKWHASPEGQKHKLIIVDVSEVFKSETKKFDLDFSPPSVTGQEMKAHLLSIGCAPNAPLGMYVDLSKGLHPTGYWTCTSAIVSNQCVSTLTSPGVGTPEELTRIATTNACNNIPDVLPKRVSTSAEFMEDLQSRKIDETVHYYFNMEGCAPCDATRPFVQEYAKKTSITLVEWRIQMADYGNKSPEFKEFTETVEQLGFEVKDGAPIGFPMHFIIKPTADGKRNAVVAMGDKPSYSLVESMHMEIGTPACSGDGRRLQDGNCN
jgi:hypothetical protein